MMIITAAATAMSGMTATGMSGTSVTSAAADTSRQR